jgi:hypothetical protein
VASENGLAGDADVVVNWVDEGGQRRSAGLESAAETLAIARLLITSQRTPGIRPQGIADRLGFPCPSRPHSLDPLQEHLSQ